MAPKSVSVTVKYSKPGTQPPIFLAGSFSDPAWQPQEMQYTTNESGEHEFYKEVQVEEGSAYQYKFRLGEGDWWMLNEDSPTVTDDVGNRNNLLSLPVSEEPLAKPKQVDHPTAAKEATSHPIAEVVNAISEHISGEGQAEHALIDTKDEDSVTEEETSREAEPKEHTMITPAHTNTPVPEAAEDIKETEAPKMVQIPEEVQLNVHHVNEDASLTPAAAEDDDARAQHIADSISSLYPTDGAQSQETGSQATSASLSPLLPGTHEPTSTPAVQVDQASPETVSPSLMIEKVDDGLQQRDDFGSAATVGQNDAHLLRSQNTVPDHVIMRLESSTPELADTAAEVSESAALLDRDRDPPTPPMSDEEAGRIGYRRMSSTPIPEVAKTAAEVADVAATLDERPALHLETAPKTSDIRDDDEEELLDSGASTPASQKAPRFSYECLGEEDIGVPALPTHSHEPTDPLEPVSSPYDEPVVVDWNDPSIEIFPTDRAGIIHTIRRLSERLPEDIPDLDIVPPSPVIGPNGQLLEPRSPIPSPAVGAHQISPSLDSITEENDELQETLVSMPAVSKLSSSNSDKENAVLSKGVTGSDVVPNGEENTKLDEVKPEKVATVPIIEIEEARDDVGSKEIPSEKVAEEEVRESKLSSTVKVEEPSAGKEDSSSVEEPQGSGEPELTSKEQREEISTVPEEISSEVKEVSPESPPTAPVEPTMSEKPPVPSATTPFVVGERKVGNDEEEVREFTTSGDSPNIIVQPATPAASKTEFIPKPLDTAKTTAIEEENGRQVKSRKNPRSQSPERPVTPGSVRSATRDAKSKNFLKAFWRVVFVDWIGGLIRALCGGRGGYTLLAVGAIAMVVIAPTLYSSYTGFSLWG